MHLSSTLRICCPHQLHSSSTPCMIHTVMVQILSVAIHSVSVKVYQPLFLMVSGLTSQIMMLPLSLSSLSRGTLGVLMLNAYSFFIYSYLITRSLNPLLLFSRYVDAVLTIPKGTIFPMCGMNLAFNRELIGPAMYFGLMGDGQPIGRYDDMWAGWCTKVI